MALQVIGAGLGRTGTMSLKAALEKLGIGNCHHMLEVFANLDRLPLWLQAARGKADWDAIFDGYGACVDYPSCTYWREIADHWPDASILLSTRDPESWFDSVSETIFSPAILEMLLASPLADFFRTSVLADFGDRIGDRGFMTDYFRRWNADVIASVPPGRLLVFEAKQGWEPLCAFLGVPVPDEPFPRVNSREEMAAGLGDRHAEGGDLVGMARARIAELRQ